MTHLDSPHSPSHEIEPNPMNSTRTGRIPIELKPEVVTAVIDTREQLPLDLSPLGTVAGTLSTGDYSVAGLETLIAIERKSLPDLLSCVGQERERFDREVQRLLAYPVRAVVVEATWLDLERGEWRSRVTPAAAVGSVLGWTANGVPFLLVGDRAAAGRTVAKMLFLAARRRWREMRPWLDATLNGGVVEQKNGAIQPTGSDK